MKGDEEYLSEEEEEEEEEEILLSHADVVFGSRYFLIGASWLKVEASGAAYAEP